MQYPYYRLGVPVKIVGQPGLRSHDSRRWQNNPHLSVSLAYLRDVLTYLDARDIRLYRLSGQLAPYLTHPEMPHFHHQIEECSTELAAIGDMAREFRIRLTLHPAFFVQLASPDSGRVERSIRELEAASQLLDAMGLGLESVIVIHVGGLFEGKQSSLVRFSNEVCRLPESIRQRIALENDDRHYGMGDALWIHNQTGIRIIMDLLHHRVINPSGHAIGDALAQALSTWPVGEQPKVHFSSSRTEARTIYRDGRPRLQVPLANQHSDFLDCFAFIEFLRSARKMGLRPFDVMLEAKGKDLALLRLRGQIVRFAPDLANVVK